MLVLELLHVSEMPGTPSNPGFKSQVLCLILLVELLYAQRLCLILLVELLHTQVQRWHVQVLWCLHVQVFCLPVLAFWLTLLPLQYLSQLSEIGRIK